MKQSTFENRKAVIWAKLQKEKGIFVPENIRESWEENAGIYEHDDDPEIALQDLSDIIQDRLDDYSFIEAANYFEGRKPPVELPRPDSTPKKLYQRPFGKRLYLVEFIMERYFLQINRKRNPKYERKRINWKKMTLIWNEFHPHDNMSPEVLKVRYYRAIADPDIQRAYIKRRFIRIPMDARVELVDKVKIVSPNGQERTGHISNMTWAFTAPGLTDETRRLIQSLSGRPDPIPKEGEAVMNIRLAGDELSSEKANSPGIKRIEKQSKEGTT